MAYFPMFIDLKEKKCIVVGGGKVALRKVESLIRFESEVIVIAPELCDEMRALEGQIQILQKEAEEIDLKGSFLVIAATNKREINHAVSTYCRREHIFVNVIDSKEECSFVFPATVKRETISIGITTSGGSPHLSSSIRKKIEQAVPEYYGTLAQQLGEWREELKDRILEEPMRRKIFRQLVEEGMERKEPFTREDLEQIIKENTKKE